MTEHEFILVDRRVAETMCIATHKAVKSMNKQAVFVTCHYDVLQWLQPDWYFDTGQMRTFFPSSHASERLSPSRDATTMRGESLANIII